MQGTIRVGEATVIYRVMHNRLNQYALLMRLHKPIGILLLLWPTLWALWIAAEGMPNLLVLIVFIDGVILMRSAGCVINDYADRDIDPQVARTKDRPIASGKVSANEALVLFTILCLMAFGLVLLMNRLTILLSLVAVALAVIYPFTKRYTQLPQIVLGAAFGWAIPMAFAAQTGAVPPVAWVLFCANILWATVYDTLYAMVDREDDLRIGVKSTAILFGSSDVIIIGILQVLVISFLTFVAWQAALGLWFFLSLIAGAILFLYQQVLIKDRDRDQCFRAFLNNNWFGMTVFIGIFLDYLLWA